MSDRAYTLREMRHVIGLYDFKKSEIKTIARFIQTLINHDFEKDPPKEAEV